MKRFIGYFFVLLILVFFSYFVVRVSGENREYIFSLGFDYDEIQKETKEEKLFNNIVTLSSNLSDNGKAVVVNLSEMRLFLINKAFIENEYEIVSKGPDDKWFKTPAGVYRVGAKYFKHLSSKSPVYMPFSFQFYEDFFIHGIPYYANGERVDSDFSGGCLRLEDKYAEIVFDFVKYNTPVILIEKYTKDNINLDKYAMPVNFDNTFIINGYLSPSKKIKGEYLQHTGITFATLNIEEVYSIMDGEISSVFYTSVNDKGFGNTIIIKHDEEVYSLYAHLSSFSKPFQVGDKVKKGEVIGFTGTSGYGCNQYWKLENNGCDKNDILNPNLYFEIKKGNVLHNPYGGQVCEDDYCYEYSLKYPRYYGYYSPIDFLKN
ncbi:MAG: peptidoglycan DD-metalloendopeptidase family protein [Candidatus Pacebacteria bacterium]|nr:peptidoglycan DD-metalloendopeptidase family protein [Candidatus Paceibacterota bacterium]